MIRRHVGELQALLVLSDALLAVATFTVISSLRFGDGAISYWAGVVHPPELAGIIYALGWIGTLALGGLYRPQFQWTIASEVVGVLRATIWAALGAAAILFLVGSSGVSRLFFLAIIPCQGAITAVSRTALRVMFRRLQAGGHNVRTVLIVGTGERGRAFAQRVEANTWLGLRVVGFLEAGDGMAASLPDRWVHFGDLECANALLEDLVIDEVAICVPETAWDDRVDAVVRLAEDQGKIVRIPLGLLHRPFVRGQFELLDGLPVYSVVAGPDRALAMTAKRVIDLVGAAAGLLILSPILAVVALAVLVLDGQPLLFVQERIGENGRRFRLYKFRTMVDGAESMLAALRDRNRIVGPGFQLDDDPRVTRLGRTLRRSSLDELPQLWNVLRGDMSIVGPRPAPMTEVGAYECWHRRRLSAKPGITGLAQVEARSYREFNQKANLDLQYIDRWSLGLDFQILFRTVRVLARRNGR